MRTHFGKTVQWKKPKDSTDLDGILVSPSYSEIEKWKTASCDYFVTYFSSESMADKLQDAIDLDLLTAILNYCYPDFYTKEPVTILDQIERSLKDKPDALEQILKLCGFSSLERMRNYSNGIKEEPLKKWQAERAILLNKNPTLLKEENDAKALGEEVTEIGALPEVLPDEAQKMLREMNWHYQQYPLTLTPLIDKLKKYLPFGEFPPERHYLSYTNNSICKAIRFYYPKVKAAVKGLAPEPPAPPKEDIFVSNLKWFAKHMEQVEAKRASLTVNHSPEKVLTKVNDSKISSTPKASGVTSSLGALITSTAHQKDTKTASNPPKEHLDRDTLIKLGNTITYDEANSMLKEAQNKGDTNDLFDYLNNAIKFQTQGYGDPLKRGLIKVFYEKVFGKKPIPSPK